MRDNESKPRIIDEDGQPVTDTADNTQAGAGRGTSGSGTPFGTGTPFGATGFPIGGVPPIPEHMLGRDGKPSLRKIIGWKGVAALTLIAAVVIGLIALSFMVFLIALPIIILIAIIGWVVGKVRGTQHSAPSATRSIRIVRNRP